MNKRLIYDIYMNDNNMRRARDKYLYTDQSIDSMIDYIEQTKQYITEHFIQNKTNIFYMNLNDSKELD